MKVTVAIKYSVGKYGTNRAADVRTIQTRLNEWIAYGRLPGLDLLKVDGQCGKRTKTAIGAFQLRYVMGVTKPDCRCDPGGATVTHMGLDFTEGPRHTPGDPVYDGWLQTQIDYDDGAPYWEKRSSVWYGYGAKAGAQTGPEGMDLSLVCFYNEKNPANRFQAAVHTRRQSGIGGGAGASVVVCLLTGIYHPSDMASISESGWDFNISLVGRWGGLAKTIAKFPKIAYVAEAAKVGKYVDLGTASQLVNQFKSAAALNGLQWGTGIDPNKAAFLSIDTPAGIGLEVSLFYGITGFSVLHQHLV